jgi:hypothetical protein
MVTCCCGHRQDSPCLHGVICLRCFWQRRDHTTFMILTADFDRSVLRRRFVIKFAKLLTNHRIKHIKKIGRLKSEFTRWMRLRSLDSIAGPHQWPRVHRVFDSIYGFLRIILVRHVSQTLHFCTPIKILTVDGPMWFWGFSYIDLMIKEA